MPKAGRKPDKPPEGVAASPPAPGPRPWTREEMEAARPLPLPETEAGGATPAASVLHMGAGSSKPGGPPE